MQTYQGQNRKLKEAHEEFLVKQTKQGFTPKWYIVFHLNHKPKRIDTHDWDKDIRHIKNMLFQTLYGKYWKKSRDRARAIWGLEFGKGKVRPHINLLLEGAKSGHDRAYLHHIFNEDLPNRIRCMWSNEAEITEVTSTNICGYFLKECTPVFCPILYTISDIIT